MTTENKPAEEATIPINEQLFEIVSRAIDEAGVYPAPGLARFPDGKTEFAMIVEPETAYEWFWKKVHAENATEVIFGLDRYTEPDQGTEFADVVTVCHWRRGEETRFGVINYQIEPRIVRNIDWQNHFWSLRLAMEVLNSDPKRDSFSVSKSQ